MRVSWLGTIIAGGNEYPVTVTDISLSGARVETTTSFPIDEVVLLDIHGIAKLSAKLVRESNGVIGLQFVASPNMVSEKVPAPYADLL